MPTGWFKRKIRPWLIALARRRVGSTRRGPVQTMVWTTPWIQSHPKEGRFLLREKPRKAKAARPLNQATRKHSAFEAKNFHQGWGTFVAEIQGAFVTGPSVGVITPNRRLLADVSFEFSGWPQSHSAMRKVIFPKPTFLKGTWVLLATTGGDSYYHHMVECAPRMELLRRAALSQKKVDGWIVNGTCLPYQKETWQRLGLDAKKIRTLADGAYYQCERLWTPSLPSAPGCMWPETAGFLKKLFVSPSKRKPYRLLYVPRQGLPSRQLLDEKRVFEYLRTLGFEIFSPGKMTVAEQARIFAEARAVVGPHGGAMTNVVFTNPGALVIEFFHPRYVNPCYWRVAWANRCRYAYLLGEANSADLRASPGDSTGHIRLGDAALEELKKVLGRQLAQS